MSDELLNEEELVDQVTLTLEDGTELVCDVLAIFPCDDKMYIALVPVDNPDNDIYLYGYEEDEDGEITLIDIESDEELEAASDAFDEFLDSEEFESMFGFDDEEDED